MGNEHDHKPQEPPHVRTMHEGVTEADDPACCCEPEPRWRELGEELERENQRQDQSREARARPT